MMVVELVILVIVIVIGGAHWRRSAPCWQSGTPAPSLAGRVDSSNHVYIYIYIHVCIYIYIYIYIWRERERERYIYIERERIIHVGRER